MRADAPRTGIDVDAALAGFHPATSRWFSEAFGAPTLPQARAWPLVQRHESVLVLAQTGSGKTLAAFLAVVDRLVQQCPTSSSPTPLGTKVVYVSPSKALATDVERNLRAPPAGIARCAGLLGLDVRLPTVAVRTGDTDARERARYRRQPADILITTPESLALLLRSRAGLGLAQTETVFVDEIHALVPTKRGAHLALTLERLEDLVRRSRGNDVTRPLQRIGLSTARRACNTARRRPWRRCGRSRRQALTTTSSWCRRSTPRNRLAPTCRGRRRRRRVGPTAPRPSGRRAAWP
jgi:ATP-dependent Lhr-like helicase